MRWRMRRHDGDDVATRGNGSRYRLGDDGRLCQEARRNGLAEPRFPSLPNIVKARRKPVYEVGLARVESDFSASVGTLRQAHASKKCCQYIDAESLMRIISGGR